MEDFRFLDSVWINQVSIGPGPLMTNYCDDVQLMD